jgi:glyoxylase-like metal-dependent hydrolase (beta-lactamase superfamily II)
MDFIILTHGHFDHTGGVNTIKKELNIPVFMNEKDSFLTSERTKKNGIFPVSETIVIDRFVNHGETIKYGDDYLLVICTPGHTPGGITIKTGDVLFTGDTLFADSIGRTDFPGGSYEQLINSVKQELFRLPDDTKVCPGHGPSTTIGCEKRNNPFF